MPKLLQNEGTVFSNILREAAVFSPAEKVKKYMDGKVVFEAYLQEAENQNQNKRYYPYKVLNTAMDKISDKIQRRAFLGELDHPISDNQVRQTTVLYAESSHLIREWGWDGTMLKGVIETLPYTVKGKALSGLVLDRIPVGFSLRGLADLEDSGQYQLVLDPLFIISFDSVSEPSHSKATVQEIRNENVVQIIKESKQLICCSNGRCYLPDYFDQLVETQILRLSKYSKV